MLSGFFKNAKPKPSAGANPGEKKKNKESVGTPGGLTCAKHGNPAEMLCECKGEPLCEDCYSEH